VEVSLVYASAASRPFDAPELAALLAGSRERNGKRGLTGMLLYKDGWFMQVLEGEERAVQRTFRRISRDKRHRYVRVLAETPIAAREFPEWTMGFSEITDESLREIPGYDGFLERASTGPSWATPSRARVLLDWFRLRPADPS
jgi:hypothetical protein